MHQITGFYFFNHANGKKYVIYSTLYSHGRYANTFECTGLTDEQAKGKFLIDHSNAVDFLIAQKKKQESQSKIIV